MDRLVFRSDDQFADDIVHVGALDIDHAIAAGSSFVEQAMIRNLSDDIVIQDPRGARRAEHDRKDG